MGASLLFAVLLFSSATVEDDEFVFRPDTGRFVQVHRGVNLFIGKLDRAGNFTQDCRWQGVKVGDPLTSVPMMHGGIINQLRPGREMVYEYRSGRLIKGQLDKEGNFIPDLPGNVIDLKDYRPGKGIPVIYNLPGRLVQKSQAKKEEANKKDGK